MALSRTVSRPRTSCWNVSGVFWFEDRVLLRQLGGGTVTGGRQGSD
ncbi:hypothetical protein [Xenorhabdus littoralis]|nr:hypothetical protein [Xenorhabdus sp. Reich]